jgi:hypothetical protein
MPVAQWKLTETDFLNKCIAEFNGSVLNPSQLSVADFEVLNEELKQFSAPYKQKMEDYRDSIYSSMAFGFGCFLCTFGLSQCWTASNLVITNQAMQDLWGEMKKNVNVFVAKRNQSLAASGMMLIVNGGELHSALIPELIISLEKGNEAIAQPVSLLTAPMKAY